MFRLASMTKAVTSVAAHDAGGGGQDRARRPDQPPPARVRRPPRPPGRRHAGAGDRPPTVRELLTHTAGFSYNFMNAPDVVDAYREARVTDGLDHPM